MHFLCPISPKGVTITHPAMKTIIALTAGGLVCDEAAGEITWDFSIFTKRRRRRDHTDRRRTFPSSVTTTNSVTTGVIWEGDLQRCLLAPYKQCCFHVCALSNLSLLADSTLLQLSTISRVLGATRRGRRLITTSRRAEQYSIIIISSVRVIVVHPRVNCRGCGVAGTSQPLNTC